MYFFLIDDKNVYVNGKLNRNANSVELTHTWHPNKDLKELDVQYGYLFCEGKSFSEVCPLDLKDKWIYLDNLHKSYEKSFSIAKIERSLVYFYELLPQSFVDEYFTCKIQIMEHVFKTYSKPENYNYLLDLQFLLDDIKLHQVNIDFDLINKELLLNAEAKDIIALRNKFKTCKFVKYKNFSSTTGRLTADLNSFPILNLNKKYRKYIKPNKQLFLELDYNGAEIRTMLALNKQTQPDVDIHDWHRVLYNKNGYNFSRDEAKKHFFEWFYSQKMSSGIKEIDSFYDRDSVLNMYWDNNKIFNPYKRIIDSDKHHALSYIVQSTAWDIFSRRVIAIYKYLTQNGRCSIISMLLHDSLILDLEEKDLSIIPKLVDIFTNTEFGKFKVNVKVGKNLGEMTTYE